MLQSKVLIDGEKIYGDTKLQLTLNLKIIVVFHDTIRTMRRRKLRFGFTSEAVLSSTNPEWSKV